MSSVRPLTLCSVLIPGILALVAQPGAAGAQAEAAPEGSVPGAEPSRRHDPGPPAPRVRVSADARFSNLLGATRDVAQPLGWGYGLQLSASLLPFKGLRLGFLLDYQQDRFERTLAGGEGHPQQLIHSTFAAQALLDRTTRWLRPFVAAGVGASVARHAVLLNEVVEDSALVPLFRFSAGLGVSPLRWLELALVADLSITVSDQRGGVTVGEGRVLQRASGSLFAPGWWSLAFQAGYRFY